MKKYDLQYYAHMMRDRAILEQPEVVDADEAQAEIDELVHKLRYLERNKSRIRDEDWLSVIELIAKHKGE